MLRSHGRKRETHGLVTGRRPGLPYRAAASIHGGTAYIAQLDRRRFAVPSPVNSEGLKPNCHSCQLRPKIIA